MGTWNNNPWDNNLDVVQRLAEALGIRDISFNKPSKTESENKPAKKPSPRDSDICKQVSCISYPKKDVVCKDGCEGFIQGHMSSDTLDSKLEMEGEKMSRSYDKLYDGRLTDVIGGKYNPQFTSSEIIDKLDYAKKHNICLSATSLEDIIVPPKDEVDMINRPPHYALYKYEPIEVLDEWFGENSKSPSPLAWQVGKYLARHKHKGKPLEDLKKAQYYLNRLIKSYENKI